MKKLIVFLLLVPSVAFSQKFSIDSELMSQMVSADKNISGEIQRANTMFRTNEECLSGNFTKFSDPTDLLKNLRECPVKGKYRKQLDAVCATGDSIAKAQMKVIEGLRISSRKDILSTSDLSKIRSICDSLLLGTKTELKFDTLYSNKEYVTTEYVATDYTTVYFYFNIAAGNVDNPGKTNYVFSKATGKFSAIFPVWKKTFEPMATNESVLNRKSPVFIQTGNSNLFFTFYEKGNDYWFINTTFDQP